MANKDNTPVWKKRLEKVTLFVAIAAVLFAALQWYEMRQALLIDQRAWVSVVGPANFPLEGAFIPASIQIANTAKTPAKHIEGDVVATVLKKGEEPSFDYSGGMLSSRGALKKELRRSLMRHPPVNCVSDGALVRRMAGHTCHKP